MAGSEAVSPLIREALRLGFAVRSVESPPGATGYGRFLRRDARGRVVCFDRAGNRYIFTGKAWIRRSE